MASGHIGALENYVQKRFINDEDQVIETTNIGYHRTSGARTSRK